MKHGNIMFEGISKFLVCCKLQMFFGNPIIGILVLESESTL